MTISDNFCGGRKTVRQLMLPSEVKLKVFKCVQVRKFSQNYRHISVVSCFSKAANFPRLKEEMHVHNFVQDKQLKFPKGLSTDFTVLCNQCYYKHFWGHGNHGGCISVTPGIMNYFFKAIEVAFKAELVQQILYLEGRFCQ